MRPVDCDIGQQILDLALACNDALDCHPLALLGDSSIVDCSTGKTHALGQGTSAERVILNASSADPLQTPLLAMDANSVVEYAWHSEGNWTPLWKLSTKVKDLIDLSWGIHHVFEFVRVQGTKGWHYENMVRMRNFPEYELVGDWHLKDNDFITMAGCAMSDSELYMIQSGPDEPRLIRAWISDS